MQDNDFRSATNFRALANRSRSDNTFAGAINLGRVTANASRTSFRASGTVGRFDKVDFYKITFDPGVNVRANGRFQVENGSTTLSYFRDFQGNRRLTRRFTLRGNTNAATIQTTNSSQSPITVYLKVERPTGRTQYGFVFNYFR